MTARRLALLVLTLMAACLVAALAFSQEPEVRELEVEDVYMGSHFLPVLFRELSDEQVREQPIYRSCSQAHTG